MSHLIYKFLFVFFISGLTRAQFDYEEEEEKNGVLVGAGILKLPEVDYDKWDNYWPPSKDNPEFTEDAAGQKKWEEYLKGQQDKWRIRRLNGPLTRPFPYCVDGLLPYKYPNDSHSLYKDNDFGIQTPYILNHYPASNLTTDEWDEFLQNKGRLKDKTYYNSIADKDGKSPNGFVTKIDFEELHSPDGPDANKFGIGIGRMRQWVHIVITASKSKPLAGLFIQGISGPVGVPFGEFRKDFNCKDQDKSGNEKEVDIDLSYIIPCKYRPRASVRHPNIYKYMRLDTPKEEFRVHFNWEDVKCCNAPRIQFLIIATRTYKTNPNKTWDYETFFTQAYEHDLENGVGVPDPYYKQWKDEMVCKKSKPGEEIFKIKDTARSNLRIFYSPEYDKCITAKTVPEAVANGLTDSGCPPGPFVCTETDLDTRDKFQNHLNKVVAITSGNWSCNCPDPADTEPILRRTRPTTRPTTDTNKITSTTVPTTPKSPEIWIDIAPDWINNTIKNTFRKSRGIHAYMMTLSWMLLVSVGTFLSRYFKETAGLNYNADNGCLGTGPWLCTHIMIMYVAAALMWTSLVETFHWKVPNPISCDHYHETDLKENCNSREEAVRYHKWMGSLSVLFFHLAFISGWFRPMKSYMSRIVFVYGHTFFGYAGKLLSVGSVILVSNTPSTCSDAMVGTILLEIVSVGFFLVGCCVERLEDRQLGRRRHVFPVPEANQIITNKKRSLSGCKFFTYLFSWVVQIILCLLVIYSYQIIFQVMDIDGEVDKLSNLTCLIGSGCTMPSVATDAKIYTAMSKEPI